MSTTRHSRTHCYIFTDLIIISFRDVGFTIKEQHTDTHTHMQSQCYGTRLTAVVRTEGEKTQKNSKPLRE